MLNIGCHLSLSKGYAAMGHAAVEIAANTFQFFTRNPRGGDAKEINPQDAAALGKLINEQHFAPLLAHAPYTLNLCSADVNIRTFGHELMIDDLRRLEQLPCKLYNIHPGSHTGQGAEAGVAQITEALNKILNPSQAVTVLLETMSGKGSEVGASFEEIKAIIDGVELQDKMGVCIDTCHVYAAGYDIVNDLDGVLTQFDKIVGLGRLKAVHLNDSMTPFNSRKDRHELLGKGSIGLDALTRVINHSALRHLPFLLETPNKELTGYAEEIRTLRDLYRE
jgi:deoxyribonuclease-4